ncbi:MAG: ABC transporter ATP-binding protein [Planctomycetota bacterium]|nr:ABC transporter ATP-binding protein [Planctomycetota bacterium]
MSLAELVDLEKSYRMGADLVVEALRGVTLRIEEGEYLAIMGASGSGKSTLLNLLGCLDRPTSGRYLLGGEDVSQLSDGELSEVRGQRIGFVFQSFNLIPQLSALDNIEVPLFYQGMHRRDRRRRATALAEQVGLGPRARHKPMELSGGEQQRVAIARALANDPLIILADEPTGNLDSKTGLDILTIFDDLTARGRTLIVVTHDENIARRTHRVVRLADGRVVTPPTAE